VIVTLRCSKSPIAFRSSLMYRFTVPVLPSVPPVGDCTSVAVDPSSVPPFGAPEIPPEHPARTTSAATRTVATVFRFITVATRDRSGI
jgi:hypothetical protein